MPHDILKVPVTSLKKKKRVSYKKREVPHNIQRVPVPLTITPGQRWARKVSWE